MPHRSENWGKTLSGLRSRGHGVGGCVCGGVSPPGALPARNARPCYRLRPLPASAPRRRPGERRPQPGAAAERAERRRERPAGRCPGRARGNDLLALRALCVSAALPGGSGSRPPPPHHHHHHVAEARRGGERGRHVEGKVLSRRRRDAARASRGRGGPRATAMPGQPAPAPGRAASPRSRFGAPRGVTPSSHQRHPARCPSRRARSQGRRAPPDPPEPGPYPRAGRRCLH